jgi:sulfide dehydrogenase cytochrome subunit
MPPVYWLDIGEESPMKILLLSAACAAALVSVGTVQAQAPNAGRNLAATCFTCHGTDGRSVGGIPPSLAGQDRNYLLQAMKDFKAGKRPATIMHQQAKGYTDQELEVIADYFARAKAGPGVAAPAPSSRN